MRRELVFFLGVAFLSACSSLGESNLASPTPLSEFKASARVTSLWSVEFGEKLDRYSRMAPMLQDNTIYTTDATGLVTAWNRETGRKRWQTNIELPASGATGFGEGLVLVGTRDGRVAALQSDSGKLTWIGTVSSEILAPPAAASGVVVAQTVDGKLFGLSVKDGNRLWVYRRSGPALSLRGTSAPLIYNNMVVSGFANSTVVGLELKSGRVLWNTVVARPKGRTELERLVDVDAPPLIVGNRLFAVSFQGSVIALDLRSGRRLWSRKLSSYTALAADRDRLYLVDESSVVRALDQRSGADHWKQEGLRARFLTAPTAVAGYIAVGDLEGYVHWLSRDDGSIAARTSLGDSPIIARAAVRGDTLFVSNQSGRLAALQIQKK